MLTKEAFHMLKKNTRKRLLAGALATVMMLTMCPSWALADDEDIATTQPLVDENRPVVDSAPVEADTTETPADPTPSEPEAKPAEDQNTAPAPSEGGANGGTDSTESGNSTNSTIPEGSGNISQKNDVVSNSPENEISMASLDAVPYGWNDVKTIEAEYWITNAPATDANNVNTLTISSDMDSITSEGGIPVTELALPTRADIIGYETTVFGHARVLGIGEHQVKWGENRSTSGTEIDAIRCRGNYLKHFEYHDKKTGNWKRFDTNLDQLVFYYLVRTDYSRMVQIDVSDWAYDDLSNEVDDAYRSHPEHRSVTYQVIVMKNDGTEKPADSRKFWYNRPLTVSLVAVREIDSDYTIDHIALDPSDLGSTGDKANGEYKFSLDLSKAGHDNATVKIYVKSTKLPHKLTYDLNGGQITNPDDPYTREGDVYPKQTIIVPEVAKDNCTFDGWYTDKGLTQKWTDTTMPDEDLTLHAKWVPDKYTVTWKNGETTLDTEKVPYNGKPTMDPRDKASKPSDKQFDYTFKGWKLEGDTTDTTVEPTNIPVTKDVTYVAVFDKTERKYTVTWENEGTTLGTEPVAYGKTPTKTFTPEKPSTPEFDYKFLGWKVKDGDGKLVEPNKREVTADVTYIAVFEETKRQYTVTYYINGTEQYETTKKYAVGVTVPVEPTPTWTGRTFTGWTSNDVKLDGASFTMPAKDVTIQGFLTQNKRDYTINKHFYDEKGTEVKVNSETKTGNEYALISELYKKDAVNQTVDGKTYVYVSGLTTVTDKLETLTKDVTIDLHYYLNVEGGNDIPDAWEHRLTFKVVNGEWNDGGNADKVVYVQFKDEKTGKPLKDEAVVVPVTRIPAVGNKPNSGYHAGAWDTTPVPNAPVKQDTVFTYTYAKNSSGGSSGGSGGHHRKPTVTIPDKVPTGLNGNDHYAYIVGYPDKTVRPQNGITRAEVATIFFRLLTDETRNANSTKSNSYSDVAAGAWYNHAVSTLSAMGIVKGDSNGKFNPNAPITRAEFAAIAARFDDKANSTTADFSDIVSHWAKNEISAASNNGWINGYPDGTFRPDNKITRAEAMTLVNRVLKRLPETAEDLHDDMIKWSDNSDASQWFYLAVQEATNSHYYKAKENKSEKWTELRDTRDWTELEK